MFDPSVLPRRAGQLVLITDRLAAPADFVVLSILAAHLKHSYDRKCMLVSFSQTFSHWKSLAARLSPPTNLSNRSFIFVDALSEPPTRSLRSLYDTIRQAMEQWDPVESDYGANMVILDSLSFLEWSGIPLVQVKRFLRAIRALCVNRNAALVVRHHRITSDDLDDLARGLLLQCAWHLEVLPLSSGRSGAISGEIALHRGPLLGDSDTIDAIGRSAAVQYRLSDTGTLYFDRGTSAGVL